MNSRITPAISAVLARKSQVLSICTYFLPNGAQKKLRMTSVHGNTKAILYVYSMEDERMKTEALPGVPILFLGTFTFSAALANVFIVHSNILHTFISNITTPPALNGSRNYLLI